MKQNESDAILLVFVLALILVALAVAWVIRHI
jgi:hypothetical protein